MASDSDAAPAFYPYTEDNHSALVVVASLVFFIYAILGMVTKLLIRLNITSLKDYDFTLLGSLFLYFVQTACIIAACNNGLGQHRDGVSEDDFLRFSKLVYAARIFALFVAGTTKISLCLLIRQIDNQGKLNKANLALGGIVVLWVVSGFFATVFQCPLPSPWIVTSNEQCPNYGGIFLYIGVMDILTDLALCVLPVAMMWQVQTTFRRKIIVMSLFGSRIIVPIVTIPSLSNAKYLFHDYSDPTWSTVSSTIWFQVSLGLSVLTVCIPSLKGVIDSLLGSTAVAAIQAPYELKDSGGRSGLQPTMLGNSNSSKQASRDVSRLGMLSSKGKSPESSGWYPEHTMRSKHGGDGSLSGSGSESVRKLTEGVIVVRDEFEISYDDRRASTSRAGSRESADAGYRRVEHI